MAEVDWLARVAEGESLPGATPTLDDAGHVTLDQPDRYTDRGVIASGGMATIRAASDRATHREVAVKLLHPSYAKQPAHLQSFVEEALITGQLTHPNIIPLYDLGRDQSGMVYFTMPRVEGRTLHEILRDPAYAPGSSRRLEVALEVFLKVCDAVAFAHSRGVVHRDLKPVNIMVGVFGEVYLMDWGHARVLPKPGAVVVPRSSESPLAKRQESPSGTPAYMAPEQVAPTPRFDERTDVFGLGATLYEIVGGRPPYQGNQEAVLRLAREAAAPPVDAGRPFHVQARLVRLIQRAMSRDPEDRFPRVEDLATQVRGLLRAGMHMPFETFGPGDVIIREGDPGDRAYILMRGECEVTKMVDGQRRTLRRMQDGAIFGEAAMLSDAPRSATVEAVSEVSVIRISRADMEDRLAPDTWEGLLVRTLVQRFRELDERLHPRQAAP